MWDREKQTYWITRVGSPKVVDAKNNKAVCNFHAAFLYEKDFIKEVCFAENIDELEQILTSYSQKFDWKSYHELVAVGLWAIGKEYKREDYIYEAL